MVKELKARSGLEDTIQLWTTILHFRSFQRIVAMIKPISFFFIDFRKYFDTLPEANLWNRLEEIKVPFELRVVVVSLYENVISNFRST
jgi:hypothetical protein